ncbi:MAG: nitrous oxide reductase family maturation protein NosD [Promethearchaeota archaeon]
MRLNASARVWIIFATILFLHYQITFMAVGNDQLSVSWDSILKPLVQNYIVHDPISISNDEELAATAIRGTGTIKDPYMLTGLNISTTEANGIYITGTTKVFRVTNCLIQGSSLEGIYIDNVAAGTAFIADNTCNNNTLHGIFIKSSRSSIVENNTCSNNEGGGIQVYESNFSIVCDNICQDNDEAGISLWFSESPTIINNNCNHNTGEGIFLNSSSFTLVCDNHCYDNYNGIRTLNSENNSILWNVITGNENYGVTLEYPSDYNHIHHNTFIDNGNSWSQAYDAGKNNQWYDSMTQEGNYWSDSAGQSSYGIAGPAEASDLYILTNIPTTCTTATTPTTTTEMANYSRVPSLDPRALITAFMVAGGSVVCIIALVVSLRKSRYRPRTVFPVSPTAQRPLHRSSVKFCTHCSHPYVHTGTFCMECGQKLEPEDPKTEA